MRKLIPVLANKSKPCDRLNGAVCIVTRLPNGLPRKRGPTPCRIEQFVFPQAPIMALEPNQPPTSWILGEGEGFIQCYKQSVVRMTSKHNLAP